MTRRAQELPLVFFTLLVPTSVGVCGLALMSEIPSVLAVFSALLATAGMLASIAHLARPLKAPFSLLHWKTSWLSREILAVGAYWGIVVLWGLLSLFDPYGIEPLVKMGLNAAATAGGIVLMFVISRAYRIALLPAWDGNENVLELFATALGPGVAVGASCVVVATPSDDGLMVGALVLLIAGLALDIIAHVSRVSRLKKTGDAKLAALSQEKYCLQYPRIRCYCGLTIVAVCIAAFALLFADTAIVTGMWLCVAAIELVAHYLARTVFYGLLVHERPLARLR